MSVGIGAIPWQTVSDAIRAEQTPKRRAESCRDIFVKIKNFERRGLMSDTKQVRIKIESKIENLDASGLPTDSPERTEQELCGSLRAVDDGFLLTYAEKSEGGDIASEVFARAGFVRVARRGAIESCFEFVKGVSHSSVYAMGQYKFDVKIDPRRVDASLSEDGGMIDLLYNMCIGGADKAVRMKIWIRMN